MNDYICTICEYEGKGVKAKRGSKGMEIFIWAVLLVPGPFYSAYRRLALKRACPNCKMTSMVKTNSAEGMRLIKKLDAELGFHNDGKNLVEMKPLQREVVDVAPKQERVPDEQKTKIDPDAW